jgi:hypothetical protein
MASAAAEHLYGHDFRNALRAQRAYCRAPAQADERSVVGPGTRSCLLLRRVERSRSVGAVNRAGSYPKTTLAFVSPLGTLG